jgi:hypothetical protein
VFGDRLVARILRHTGPKLPFEVYGHLVRGYLHAPIDRLLQAESSSLGAVRRKTLLQ